MTKTIIALRMGFGQSPLPGEKHACLRQFTPGVGTLLLLGQYVSLETSFCRARHIGMHGRELFLPRKAEERSGNTLEIDMKTLLITTPLAASILLSTTVLAAGTTAVGTIKNVDKKGDAITLDDGNVYILSEGFEAETFAAGEKVTINFKMKNGKMIATSVKKSK